MPRYCAAFSCSNRGGQAGREERRLSFYPFPIHDRKRLRLWLQNLKRGSWTPSKHHFLCSDHFTLDSFDVRWGIRYLKQNAVPTIFSFPQNLQEQKSLSQALNKIKPEAGEETHTASDPCTQAENFDTVAKGDMKGEIANTIKIEKVSFTVEQSMDMCLHETSLLVKTVPYRDTEFTEKVLNTVAETGKSDALELEIESEQSNFTSTENIQPNFEESLSVLQQCNNNSSQMNVFTETMEPNQESIITILLPFDYSDDPSLIRHSLVSAEQHFTAVENQEFDDSACNDIDSDAEVLQIEHSYCRHDFDREDLWQKISNLNAKIAFLEGQENNTVSKLKSLEALIGKLREENLLSEEKLKIVENCFTAYEVTMA